MLKQWFVTIAERDYKIELEHNIWTNSQKVSINGQVIFESPTKLYMGGVICFTIEDEKCAIVITNKLSGFYYELVVNSISITTQKKVKYAATPPAAVLVNGVVQKTN
jgi:hypothetical protein